MRLIIAIMFMLMAPVFLSGCGDSAGGVIVIHPSLLDVKDGSVADNATDAPLNPSFVLKFNTRVATGMANTDNIILATSASGSSANKVPLGNIIANAANTVFSFSPAILLQPSTKYYLIINKNISESSGTTTYSFTTTKVSTNIAPTVSLVSPTELDYNNSMYPLIQIKFSAPIDVASINPNQNLSLHLVNSTGLAIGINILSIDNTREILTLAPNMRLQSNTAYSLVIGANIKASDKKSTVITNNFNFRVGPQTTPQALMLQPGNNATNTLINQNLIKIGISMKVVPNLGVNNFIVHEGGATGTMLSIAAIKSLPNNVYELKLSSNLKYNTAYTVELTGVITDKFQNHLIPAYFNFTTGGPFICVSDNGSNQCGCLITNDGLTNPLIWFTYIESTTYNISTANNYLNTIFNDSAHCGYSNWRIPTINLESGANSPSNLGASDVDTSSDLGRLGNFASTNNISPYGIGNNFIAWLNQSSIVPPNYLDGVIAGTYLATDANGDTWKFDTVDGELDQQNANYLLLPVTTIPQNN